VEKAKTMGKLEHWLGIVYGLIITAYITLGQIPPMELILLALLFTLAYFGHWGFLIIEKWVDNQIIIKQLEVSKDETVGATEGDTPAPSARY
jgi:hypothetical protein